MSNTGGNNSKSNKPIKDEDDDQQSSSYKNYNTTSSRSNDMSGLSLGKTKVKHGNKEEGKNTRPTKR